jgi:mono/diheme cytochrome c family protein
VKKFVQLSYSLWALMMMMSCEQNHFKEGIIFAGGTFVTSAQLNAGKSIYEEYCMACHGVNGDGRGITYKGMSNTPRDFKLGLYKFGTVVAGELPTDADFKRIIQKGLKGTAMLSWDISDEQTYNVTQYIKTFALKTWEGKDKKLGIPIVGVKDPYGEAHKTSAIVRGREIYHLKGDCQSCHRAYVTPEELNEMSLKVDNEGIDRDELDEDFYSIKPQDTDYGYKVAPPDFTWHIVKSATTVQELFVRISAGVNGTGMPSWKDTLEDNDIWAVSYYIKSLMDMKGSKDREILIDRLKL